MRLFRTVLIAVAFAVPVAAHAKTLGEQYVAAQGIFGPKRPNTIVDGLDGRWLPLSALARRKKASAAQIDSFLKFCSPLRPPGSTIKTRDEGFSMHRVEPSREVEIDFAWIGGSAFVRNYDPEMYVKFLGFERKDDERYEDMRAQALSQTTGPANVYRPADDILVIESHGRAEIYGRCPE